MNFSESESYLLSLGNEVSAMKLGLENIRTLLVELGKPAINILKVQVAGTNGKGSVCAFLDSICRSTGIRTGLYTSPHLTSITERIKINGIDIDKGEFAGIAGFVRNTSELLVKERMLASVPTFFEQVTAIALIAFANHDVQFAILETGLGGRLDATTAANAEIAVITRIDLDHQEYLGGTIEEIAAEKAAIIHRGSTVVVAEQDPASEQVINDRLDQFGLHARWAERVSTTRGSGWLKFATDRAEYQVTELGLRGRHQIENAKAAILAAELMQEHFPITAENIAEGLQNARHPGRLEYIGYYLLDGAHNIGGALALRAYLDEFEKRPITLVFGAMQGKNVAAMCEILFPRAGSIVITQPKNSRALEVAEILKLAPRETWREKVVIPEPDVKKALNTAANISGDGQLILVTGSLYLVGEARKILNN